MWKWLYRIGVFAAVTCGLCQFVLSRHFVETRPHAPNIETGATNYYKGASGVVYLTDLEHALVEGLWAVAFSAALVSLALVILKRAETIGQRS